MESSSSGKLFGRVLDIRVNSQKTAKNPGVYVVLFNQEKCFSVIFFGRDGDNIRQMISLEGKYVPGSKYAVVSDPEKDSFKIYEHTSTNVERFIAKEISFFPWQEQLLNVPLSAGFQDTTRFSDIAALRGRGLTDIVGRVERIFHRPGRISLCLIDESTHTCWVTVPTDLHSLPEIHEKRTVIFLKNIQYKKANAKTYLDCIWLTSIFVDFDSERTIRLQNLQSLYPPCTRQTLEKILDGSVNNEVPVAVTCHIEGYKQASEYTFKACVACWRNVSYNGGIPFCARCNVIGCDVTSRYKLRIELSEDSGASLTAFLENRVAAFVLRHTADEFEQLDSADQTRLLNEMLPVNRTIDITIRCRKSRDFGATYSVLSFIENKENENLDANFSLSTSEAGIQVSTPENEVLDLSFESIDDSEVVIPVRSRQKRKSSIFDDDVHKAATSSDKVIIEIDDSSYSSPKKSERRKRKSHKGLRRIYDEYEPVFKRQAFRPRFHVNLDNDDEGPLFTAEEQKENKRLVSEKTFEPGGFVFAQNGKCKNYFPARLGRRGETALVNQHIVHFLDSGRSQERSQFLLLRPSVWLKPGREVWTPENLLAPADKRASSDFIRGYLKEIVEREGMTPVYKVQLVDERKIVTVRFRDLAIGYDEYLNYGLNRPTDAIIGSENGIYDENEPWNPENYPEEDVLEPEPTVDDFFRDFTGRSSSLSNSSAEHDARDNEGDESMDDSEDENDNECESESEDAAMGRDFSDGDVVVALWSETEYYYPGIVQGEPLENGETIEISFFDEDDGFMAQAVEIGKVYPIDEVLKEGRTAVKYGNEPFPIEGRIEKISGSGVDVRVRLCIPSDGQRQRRFLNRLSLRDICFSAEQIANR